MLNLKEEFANKDILKTLSEIKRNKDYASAIKILTNRKYKIMVQEKTSLGINRLLYFVLSSGDTSIIFNLITPKYIQTAYEYELKYIIKHCVDSNTNVNYLILKRTFEYIGEKYDIEKKITRLNFDEARLGFIKGFMFSMKRCS